MLPARLLSFSTADVLGLVSVVLAAWFALPQLLLLRRTRSVAGISLESIANSAISLVAWTGYGVVHASPWVIASSVVGLPAMFAILVLAARQGGRPRPALPLAWSGLLLTTTAADVVTGGMMIDLVLGCSILWFVAPAAVTAWRSADVSGIAAQTWWVLFADGAVFALFGLASGIGADRVYGAATLAGATVVLARLALGDRTAAAAAPAAFDGTGPIPVYEPA